MPTFIVERPAGVEWLHGVGAREQPLWDEHAVFMDDLFERGYVVLGGPLEDGSGAVLVVEADSEDDVRSLLSDDPWCSGGRDIQGVGRIRAWQIFLDARTRTE